MLNQIHQFIKKQIEFYKKTNFIEIQIGKKISDNIFINSLGDKFIDLVKEFRNYKLSYSQGKIYKQNNSYFKTFNNKNTEIKKTELLENEFILDNSKNYDILIFNSIIEDLPEFEPSKDYNDEQEYDELNVHINDDILLVFQKIGEINSIKILLNIEKDLPYKYVEEYMNLVKDVLEKLNNENIEILS